MVFCFFIFDKFMVKSRPPSLFIDMSTPKEEKLMISFIKNPPILDINTDKPNETKIKKR